MLTSPFTTLMLKYLVSQQFPIVIRLVTIYQILLEANLYVRFYFYFWYIGLDVKQNPTTIPNPIFKVLFSYIQNKASIIYSCPFLSEQIQSKLNVLRVKYLLLLSLFKLYNVFTQMIIPNRIV